MEPTTNKAPILYMTLGHPGSGKTFFARQYAAAMGIPLVDTERLRFELFEDPEYSNQEDNVVAGIADYMTEQFLSAGLSVVVDGLSGPRVRRHALRELARKYKATPFIVWVQTDINTAFNRARNRDRRNPYDKFAKQLSSAEFERETSRTKAPQHEDYVVISGKHVFRNQMNVVERKLAAIIHNTNSPRTVTLGGRVDLSRRKPRPRV